MLKWDSMALKYSANGKWSLQVMHWAIGSTCDAEAGAVLFSCNDNRLSSSDVMTYRALRWSDWTLYRPADFETKIETDAGGELGSMPPDQS